MSAKFTVATLSGEFPDLAHETNIVAVSASKYCSGIDTISVVGTDKTSISTLLFTYEQRVFPTNSEEPAPVKITFTFFP